MQLNIGCVSDPSRFLLGAVWDSGQAEGGREGAAPAAACVPSCFLGLRAVGRDWGGEVTASPSSTHPFPLRTNNAHVQEKDESKLRGS